MIDFSLFVEGTNFGGRALPNQGQDGARQTRASAQRGALVWNVPIGLEYDGLSGQIRLDADQSVRHAVELGFTLFGQLGSVRGVLNYLAREGLELPSQRLIRGIGRVISWQKPRYHVIYQMLTNPMYAGIYAYGRRQELIDPVAKTRHVLRKARSEWDVFLPNHHPGYLTQEEFEANMATLENNYNQFPANQGAVREGPTLLQGMVWCKRCGHKMRICYHHGHPDYVCDRDHRKFGTAICTHASACRVDVLVEELFLALMNANTLDLSATSEQKVQEEAALVDRHWQEKLQRLSYQAALARRRYEAVDPANRLVAATLETDWNERLVELEAVQQTYQAQRPTSQHLSSTMMQMREVLTHLRDYWYQASVTNQEKKDLLRCVIERVTLEKQASGKVIRAEI